MSQVLNCPNFSGRDAEQPRRAVRQARQVQGGRAAVQARARDQREGTVAAGIIDYIEIENVDGLR